VSVVLLPFQLDFMQRAFLVTAVVAVPMALLSCFLVLRGWSLMGDAISHAVLPGIVVAYRLGLPLALGAFVAGMVCAAATGFVKEHSRVKEDTAMGVIFSGMFAFGIVLYVWTPTEVHLDHILFGDPLGVGWGDLARSTAIALPVTLAVLAFRRGLLVHAFDQQHARAIGMPVRLLHYGLLALVSLTVVAALQAVGIILAIAVLISPGAIGFLWCRRFGAMLVVATAVGVGAALTGVYASFWIDSAPAPTIVLVLMLIFVASLVLTRTRKSGEALPSPAGAP
jgi:manganese/iron transport system permease protein